MTDDDLAYQMASKEEAKVFIGTPSGLILVNEENIKVNGLPKVIEKS